MFSKTTHLSQGYRQHGHLLLCVALYIGVAVALFNHTARGDQAMTNNTNPTDPYLSEPNYDIEGYVDYTHKGQTYKLWYGIVGSKHSNASPALVLHGGPGGNHHNLVAFQALANERPVIFYDQLGCGKSDRPNEPSLWTARRYFNEVKALRDGLKLDHYHLIGHSWGTTLATGFAARHPEGILSLSLHSPILSFPRYINQVAPTLKQNLDNHAAEVIDNYELEGQGSGQDYEEACMTFVRKHVTHTWPLPDAMKRLLAARNKQIHDVMVASGSELNVPGNLKNVDVTQQLANLTMPILFTCGRDDLCTPAFTEWQAGFANNPQIHIIEKGAHMTPIDQPQKLIMIQRSFLNQQTEN